MEVLCGGAIYRFFNSRYAVSACGKVLKSLAPFTPTKKIGPYWAVSRFLLHRMVAECWVPRPEEGKHVHHLNGDKTDNRAENLEWVTPQKHMGEYHKGTTGHYERTPEIREKLRQSRLGATQTAETRAKISASGRGKKHKPFVRALHTQEWKDNMSENHHRNAACEVFGIIYRSFAEASRATGIHRFTLRKRCLSDNFPDYKIIQNS